MITMNAVKVTYLPYIPPRKDTTPVFDLVDEAMWEDLADELNLIDTLEAAGIEEHCVLDDHLTTTVYEYTEWFYDGDESAFSVM
jgi:hypothetical protein